MPTPTEPDAGRIAAGERLCEAVRQIHAHGWCLGTSGNFSIVLERSPLELLITRSGRDKRHLVPGDLTVVDGDGRPLDDDGGRPSAETLLHCVLARRGAGSVLHTHSVAATLLGLRHLEAGGLSLTGYEMLKGLAGVETHEADEFVPVVANTQDMAHLARDLEALLGDRPRLHGFLIAGHGLYTWGRDLEEAQRHVEIFEFLFECEARRVGYAAP